MAGSLLGVFLLAKVLVLAGREIPASAWSPLAFIWQDVLVALPFLALDLLRRRPWPAWCLYGLLAGWAAVNVPVARVLSTPLTPPMLRAARGTLADSIAHHLTPLNVILMLIVLAAAAVLPFLLRNMPRKAHLWGLALAAPVLALGPIAAARVDTRGLERNSIAALVAGSLPRVPPRGKDRDFRVSPMTATDGAAPVDDLTRLRGAAAGRNVIVVVLESTGARYLAPWGAAEDPMPYLSGLAKRGVLFEDAYAVYPESIKGLFALLTSLDPGIDLPAKTHGRVRSPSFADRMAAESYRTGLFHSGRFMYLGMESIVRERGFETLEDAGAIGGDHRSSFGVDEPSAVRRILSWIDGLGGARFLAVYLPIAGHHPYETPEKGPFAEREEIGRYRNALHYADAALRELWEGIRARGLEASTVLAVFGDHGEAFLQHEGNYGHTFFVWEENVRVPLLLVLPGLVEEEVRVRRPASLIDVGPTILDLLGLPPAPGIHGRTLLDPVPRPALFFTDYSLGHLGIRDGPWKAIHEIESGRTRLFHLPRDPDEREDVSAAEPERVEAYRRHLLDWSASRRAEIERRAGD